MTDNAEGREFGGAEADKNPSIKSWWRDNLDKVIIGLLGLVVSGIAGYFSGIVAVNKQLSQIETISQTNKFKIDTMQPRVQKVENIVYEQSRHKERLDALERENQNAATIRSIIQIRDDQVKQATIQYLEKLIDEIKEN